MSTSAGIKLDEYVPDPSRRSGAAITSSSSIESSAPAPRIIDRACDFCRRRKTRCDGGLSRHSKCTNCRRNSAQCTYLESSRPRGPSKAYITALEDRVERFERLLRRLRPDTDFDDFLGPSVERGSWRGEAYSHSKPAASSGSVSSQYLDPSNSPDGRNVVASTPTSWTESSESGASDDEGGFSKPRHLSSQPSSVTQQDLFSQYVSPEKDRRSGNISGVDPWSARFCGKSSIYSIVHETSKIKLDAELAQDRQPPLFSQEGNSTSEKDPQTPSSSASPIKRRDAFWTPSPWETAWERRQTQLSFSSTSPSLAAVTQTVFKFPPPDLVNSLITIYFRQVNILFPLLHYPTFLKSFNDGLHFHDAQFAAVIWCIMAIGSRWSEDRRVLWNGWPEISSRAADRAGADWASAGWRFFLQALEAPSFTVITLKPATLFDVQSCALTSLFLRGTSVYPGGWIIVSIGLRKAIDVGAHRKKQYGSKPTTEGELWKRGFWVLVLFDRLGSAALGRPCCLREDDYDLDLPLEVDDEYWISGTPDSRGFSQPSGKPSSITAFNLLLKLSAVYANASQSIYATEKAKVAHGFVGDDWQTEVVSKLNVALDDWLDSIPQHLYWRKGIASPIFLNQSSSLYVGYHLLLIFIYRPLVDHPVMLTQLDAPTSQEVRNFPFPALAICTNAARAGLNIIEETLQQCPGSPWNATFFIQMVVAALSIFEMQQWVTARKEVKAGFKHDLERVDDGTTEGLRICERLLERFQDRWIMARNFLQKIREPVIMSRSSARHPSGSRLSASPIAYYDEQDDGQFGADDYPVDDRMPIDLHTYPSRMGDQGGPSPSRLRMPQFPSRREQRQGLPYHHTPLNLRRPGTNYGPAAAAAVHRRSSDTTAIVHRESAVRCSSPPYHSPDFDSPVLYALQPHLRPVRHSRSTTDVNTDFNSRYGMQNMDTRAQAMAVPSMGSPISARGPGPTEQSRGHAQWSETKYSLGP